MKPETLLCQNELTDRGAERENRTNGDNDVNGDIIRGEHQAWESHL